MTLDKGKGSRSSNSRSTNLDKRAPKKEPVLLNFPCGAKKGAALLEHWVEEQVFRLCFVGRFPSPADQEDADYCHCLQREGYPLEQCISFKILFDRKHKASEILFQEGGVVNIRNYLSPNTRIDQKVKWSSQHLFPPVQRWKLKKCSQKASQI